MILSIIFPNSTLPSDLCISQFSTQICSKKNRQKLRKPSVMILLCQRFSRPQMDDNEACYFPEKSTNFSLPQLKVFSLNHFYNNICLTRLVSIFAVIPNGQFCRGFWRDYPNMTSILKEIGCLAKTGTGNSLWLPVLRLCFCISDFVWIVLLFLSVVIFNPCAGTHSANSLVLPLVISPDFWLGIVFATGPFGHISRMENRTCVWVKVEVTQTKRMLCLITVRC